LLSPSSGAATRSTQFTVEAIQIAQNGPWLGINQTAANRYVESFLRAGLLPDIVPPAMVPKLRREVAVGKSRLDFSLGEDMYIEVKTMVLNMPCQDHPAFTPLKHAYKLDGARLRKHYAEVTQHMVSSTAEAAAAHTRRSAVILCHLWDAPSFNPSRAPSYAGVKEVVQAARLALSAGVEHWQVNVEIVPEGYRLLRCFRLDLQHVLEAVHDSHASVECDV
jgi:sugar fermentation stimulation protein A